MIMGTNSLSMGSEMGNNNVSGIREEEKPAVEVAERGQQPASADEVNGENHVILVDKDQDFNAKGEELPSDCLSASNGSDAEIQKSNKNALRPDIGSKESKHESMSEDGSSCQESDVRETDEGNHEEPLEIQNQPTIGKETETKEVESTDLIDSKTMSNQPSESSNYSSSASSLENSQSSLSSLTDACNSEGKENDAEKGFETDENLSDFAPEETHIVENDESEDTSDAQLYLRKNLSESCDSSSEVALECNSLDSSMETPDLQEICIIHDKNNDLVSTEPEDVENKQESTEEKLDELIMNNSAPAVMDSSSKENGEEISVKMTSISSSEKVFPNGKVKVIHKRSKSAVTGNKRCSSIDQFQEIEEDIKKLLKEKENTMGKTGIHETEKKEAFPSSMAIDNGDPRTSEECRSGFEEPSSASKLTSQNDNVTPLIPDSAEDGKKVDNINREDLSVNGKSNLDAHKETNQILDSSICTVEILDSSISTIEIQTTSRTSAAEVMGNWSNQPCPLGQIPDFLPNGRVIDMIIVESKQDQEQPAGNNNKNQVQQQRTKSSSFDFGFQLDSKSEDSDQTPLLHHLLHDNNKKTAARSFSGFANVRFQNRIIQTEHGRKSLDFEPVGVEEEEKTIRMERSDSDISRASFMNLLKKDEKGSSNSNSNSHSPLLSKNQEISPLDDDDDDAGNNKSEGEEKEEEEVGLKSVKRRSSKIKNSKASIFFTSCICCTDSIH